jgi:hypothetical protein
MRTSSKILGAAAAAAIVATGTAAFTGAGIVTSNTASDTAFIGGKAGQTVHGGTLSNVAYHTKSGTNGQVDQITLTFVGVPDDSAVDAVLTGTWSTGGAAANGFTFAPVEDNESVGTPSQAGVASANGYIVDLSGIVVTVHGDESSG